MGTARIVVGVDGSAPSLGALSWAAAEADATGAVLEAVTTWQWPTGYGWPLPFPEGFDPSADAERALEAALAPVRAGRPTLEIVTRVVEGHPAEVLVDASRGAALLVVGNRGHGAFAGMLLGSVSEHCAAHAHCPVVVTRSEPTDAG